MGIFNTDELFTSYHARIVLRDRIMGGVPNDPKIIEGWLKTKVGLDEEKERQQQILKVLAERGIELPEDIDYDATVEAIDQVATEKEANGFKRDPEHGLYVEGRQIKAMLKEATNILYAGDRWGKTQKGPKAFLAERVFVRQDRVYLGRMEPDGRHLAIGHVSGAGGQRSTLTYHEFCERSELAFDIIVANDAVEEKFWPELWILMQENGLGALRSQGYGRFDIEEWEKTLSGKQQRELNAKIREAKRKAQENGANVEHTLVAELVDGPQLIAAGNGSR
jgi:CRISPR/Cas system CSM-associated protein Csm4 (group 5 of RAMP superfamily)